MDREDANTELVVTNAFTLAPMQSSSRRPRHSSVFNPVEPPKSNMPRNALVLRALGCGGDGLRRSIAACVIAAGDGLADGGGHRRRIAVASLGNRDS